MSDLNLFLQFGSDSVILFFFPESRYQKYVFVVPFALCTACGLLSAAMIGHCSAV